MPDQRERISVWLNPGAGRGGANELATAFLAEAARRGHRASLLPTDSSEAALTAAQAVVAGGVDRLIVIGGDGTLHQAIQVAACTQVVLGLLPAGSGNDFARALDLVTEPQSAIARTLGPATPIDLLRVGDRYSATVATVGFSVDVTLRAKGIRWPKGSAKYTAATLVELATMARFPMTLDLDGQRLDVSPNFLAVANTITPYTHRLVHC
jgi:diacylglycerol kinase (ATP)